MPGHGFGAPRHARALEVGGARARTLSFVDFVGNRQYVSTGNLAENDRVCLLLIDYARRRRVKVWDTARVAELEAENRRLVALGPARER